MCFIQLGAGGHVSTHADHQLRWCHYDTIVGDLLGGRIHYGSPIATEIHLTQRINKGVHFACRLFGCQPTQGSGGRQTRVGKTKKEVVLAFGTVLHKGRGQGDSQSIPNVGIRRRDLKGHFFKGLNFIRGSPKLCLGNFDGIPNIKVHNSVRGRDCARKSRQSVRYSSRGGTFNKVHCKIKGNMRRTKVVHIGITAGILTAAVRRILCRRVKNNVQQQQ
mmetsp:Transcript_10713/g.19673  ORF Transcript_10713/g.19673 Transcript_10713/m.19673 type:complete len:219 (-) Transcript_10713:116-772(-)